MAEGGQVDSRIAVEEPVGRRLSAWAIFCSDIVSASRNDLSMESKAAWDAENRKALEAIAESIAALQRTFVKGHSPRTNQTRLRRLTDHMLMLWLGRPSPSPGWPKSPG